MNGKSYLTVRILLWVICVYHIGAGIAATFFKDLAEKVGGFLFGVSITMDPQAELLVRYLGAFGISFGVMTALAAIDPEKNTKIIYGAIVYFLVRAFDRVAFWSLLQEHHVGPVPAWCRIVAILAFAIGLFIFMPKTDSGQATTRQESRPQVTGGS